MTQFFRYLLMILALCSVQPIRADNNVPLSLQPPVITGTIGKPNGDAGKVAAAMGHNGVLLIRSQARLDQIRSLAPELAPDKPAPFPGFLDLPQPLPKIDFTKESVVLVFVEGEHTLNSLSLTESDLTANPPYLEFTYQWYNGPVAGLEPSSIKFIYAVIPATPSAKVTLSSEPTYTDRSHVVTEFSATLGGKDGGDIVDGLQVSIASNSTTIKPGEDIFIDFALHLADPGDARPEQFGPTPRNVKVWDGNYSNGYRNHACFVTTPDGKTTILRPRVIGAWDKNIPHPVTITAAQPYHLPDAVQGATGKSLKALGLDTSSPGIYKITGLYEETGEQLSDEHGSKTVMWGGSIASNTITVEVKN